MTENQAREAIAATCQSDNLATFWPMARASRTAPARSRSEAMTASLTVRSTQRSPSVYRTSCPASGKPSARKNLRVVSSGQPTVSASWEAV